MTTEVATQEESKAIGPAFSNAESFAFAQRQAQALASSDLVPTLYRNKTANCLIALEIAQRLGDSPLMVMQHLNIIHGKPSWGAQYIIAKVNACGRFSEPMEFEYFGEGDARGCYAFTTRKKKIVKGPPCTVDMAKKQGWWTREGSKWPTMTEQMLAYRAATFFGRLHTPDLLLGMRTEDEAREEVDLGQASVVETVSPSSAADKLNKRLRGTKDSHPSAEQATQAAVDAPQAPPPASQQEGSRPVSPLEKEIPAAALQAPTLGEAGAPGAAIQGGNGNAVPPASQKRVRF